MTHSTEARIGPGFACAQAAHITTPSPTPNLAREIAALVTEIDGLVRREVTSMTAIAALCIQQLRAMSAGGDPALIPTLGNCAAALDHLRLSLLELADTVNARAEDYGLNDKGGRE